MTSHMEPDQGVESESTNNIRDNGARLNVSFLSYDSEEPKGFDTYVVPVFNGGDSAKFGRGGAEAESEGDELAAYVRSQMTKRDFKGKRGQALTLTYPESDSGVRDIILIGMGDESVLDKKSIGLVAAPLYKALVAAGAKNAAFRADLAGDSVSEPELAAQLASGLLRQSYRFDKYRTIDAEGAARKPALANVAFGLEEPQKAEELFKPLKDIADSAAWAGDLTNEPANVLNPGTYETAIREELGGLPGISITTLDVAKMAKLGMGAALGVGQGSQTPPRMVIIEYDGTGGRQEQPLALVGKGITFDSGGYSIKPAAGMGDMKMDMGGSAAVVGTLRAIAARGAKAHVVGIVALAENMVSDKAYRPGDIVKHMNGLTTRVDNTDAEGRLVLSDAMTYVQRTYNPHTMIDLATLTGAIITGLGHVYTGTYANDDDLWSKLDKAGKDAGEEGWRMPLHETFAKAMRDGVVADLVNISSPAVGGGSNTAAGYLRNFVDKDADGNDKCKWAHLDIAGTAMIDGKGFGYGVRWLNQLIANDYELKTPPAPVAAPAPAPAG
jgi:leucyl aminopeptidase